jgi:hypothetical protein
LLFLLAAIHDYYGNLDEDQIYETALAVAADPLASKKSISAQEEILTDYIETTFLSPIDTSIQIYHTLNLESDIAIHYLVPVASLEKYHSFYMECVLPIYEENTWVGEKTIEIQPVLKGNYYYFTLKGLTAIHMNDVVKATLRMTAGNTQFCSKTDEYSIASYAYSTLNKSAVTQKLKTLCADLLRYGREAQLYKGYRTHALVDGAMTEVHRSYLSDTASLTFTETNKESTHLENPSVTWVGKALNLDSRVGIKLVFRGSQSIADVSKLTLHVTYTDYTGTEQALILNDPQVYHAAKGYYSFDFYNLTAAELGTVIYATIFDGNTPVSQTLTYSAESYAAKNSNSTLGPICKALFAYSNSAKAFFQTD